MRRRTEHVYSEESQGTGIKKGFCAQAYFNL